MLQETGRSGPADGRRLPDADGASIMSAMFILPEFPVAVQAEGGCQQEALGTVSGTLLLLELRLSKPNVGA